MFGLLLIICFMSIAGWLVWLARIHWVSPASDRVRFEADLAETGERLVGFERESTQSRRAAFTMVAGHAQIVSGGGYFRMYTATVEMPDGLTATYTVGVEARLLGLRSLIWPGRP